MDGCHQLPITFSSDFAKRSIQKQSIDLMNDGKRLNDIVFSVQPPPELLNEPYLQSTYDEVTVEFNATL